MWRLRLQNSLLEEAKRVAAAEGVALNQLINVAVARNCSVAHGGLLPRAIQPGQHRKSEAHPQTGRTRTTSRRGRRSAVMSCVTNLVPETAISVQGTHGECAGAEDPHIEPALEEYGYRMEGLVAGRILPKHARSPGRELRWSRISAGTHENPLLGFTDHPRPVLTALLRSLEAQQHFLAAGSL